MDNSKASNLLEASRSDLWKEDGNIVLQAGHTQFRVHRSVLCEHSVVFKDMFTLSEPSDGHVEECPVVNLPDSPKDLYHVLRALYDRRYFHVNEVQDFSVVAAMLRLSTKYAFDSLRAEAVFILKREYPSTLSAYMAAQRSPPMIDPATLNHVELANLARACDVPALLPAVLLPLTALPLGVLFDGPARADGTRAQCYAENVRAVVLGHDRLLRAQGVRSFPWLREPVPPLCEQPGRCSKRLLLRYSEIFDVTAGRSLLVFHPWDGKWGKGLCEVCKDHGRKQFEAARQAIWDELPDYFGLGSWKSVNKEVVFVED